jgi:hypothetical protein
VTHDYQDRVSLEMASIVASGLPAHPEWVTLARANLDRWTQRNHDAPGLLRCYGEWRAAILTARTDEGQRLRSNSPFVGVLSPREVWDIKRRLRDDAAAT